MPTSGSREIHSTHCKKSAYFCGRLLLQVDVSFVGRSGRAKKTVRTRQKAHIHVQARRTPSDRQGWRECRDCRSKSSVRALYGPACFLRPPGADITPANAHVRVGASLLAIERQELCCIHRRQAGSHRHIIRARNEERNTKSTLNKSRVVDFR